MDKKLQDKLRKKYPKILVGSFSIDFADGWYVLLEKLCDCIQSYVDDNAHLDIAQVEVTQIKEKFGGFRFYNTGGDNRTDGMVWFAERMSYAICEQCGSAKNVFQNKKGWIRTLCSDCVEKNKKDKKNAN